MSFALVNPFDLGLQGHQRSSSAIFKSLFLSIMGGQNQVKVTSLPLEFILHKNRKKNAIFLII